MEDFVSIVRCISGVERIGGRADIRGIVKNILQQGNFYLNPELKNASCAAAMVTTTVNEN